MDDNYRLLKLISLVAWADTGENKCGLRGDDADLAALSEDEQVRAHSVCMYYAGALQAHYSDSPDHVLDQRQFPEFTLELTTNLSPVALTMVGTMVRDRLALGTAVNPEDLARQWLADVNDTCWRLVLANHDDQFGR